MQTVVFCLQEYAAVLHEREKQKISDKHKEYEVVSDGFCACSISGQHNLMLYLSLHCVWAMWMKMKILQLFCYKFIRCTQQLNKKLFICLQAQPKLEKSKMADYMKKAAKSAAEYNRQFLRERREERLAYFDLQTFVSINHELVYVLCRNQLQESTPWRQAACLVRPQLYANCS